MITGMTESSTPSINAWLAGRLPAAWTTADAGVSVDRDEITIVLTVDEPAIDDSSSDADRGEAAAGRTSAFREETRDQRMAIAREAEHRFERKVSWGVSVGGRWIHIESVAPVGRFVEWVPHARWA